MSFPEATSYDKAYLSLKSELFIYPSVLKMDFGHYNDTGLLSIHNICFC